MKSLQSTITAVDVALENSSFLPLVHDKIEFREHKIKLACKCFELTSQGLGNDIHDQFSPFLFAWNTSQCLALHKC